MVQKGKFALCALALDKQLKRVDLPTFGNPTIPAFIFFNIYIKNAKTITEITYEEAIELSHFENNLVAPAALNNAIKKRIPINIRSFDNMSDVATLIHHGVAPKTEMITGISSLENIALISIEGSGMIGVPGFAKRVFAGLNDASINVILISQGASEHSICVAVGNDAKNQAIEALENTFEKEISNGIMQPISSSGDVSIIGLVGENMRNHPGISGRMFGSLGRNGINVLAIAQGSNERNISAVIRSSDRIKALNVLHESFFEDAKKELNLFIVGTGNVGTCWNQRCRSCCCIKKWKSNGCVASDDFCPRRSS